MIVDVGEGTEGTADPAAQGDVGICTSFQQLLHRLGKEKKQVQDKVRVLYVWGGGGRWCTRSFPVAIARERGECPLQRRSVLALWESSRATTLLAFCKKTNAQVL